MSDEIKAELEAVRAERDELAAMLGKGPYVPLHQHEEVCRQRDALRARLAEVDKYLDGGGPSTFVPRIRLDKVTAENEALRAEREDLQRERYAQGLEIEALRARVAESEAWGKHWQEVATDYEKRLATAEADYNLGNARAEADYLRARLEALDSKKCDDCLKYAGIYVCLGCWDTRLATVRAETLEEAARAVEQMGTREHPGRAMVAANIRALTSKEADNG